MPISGLKTRVALAASVAALSLLAPAMATATEGVDLRVVNTVGTTLTELRQYTGTVHIDTDPGADCFGAGTGGSGKSVRVAGPTALGLVNDASETDADLRPLSVTDAFSFGLGVCGIGGFESSGDSFWYLKVDHFGSQTGGDQTPVGHGDTILWYLSPGFPPPRELFLRAPARAEVGVPYRVTVLSYGDGGGAAPAAGATVTDAALPTDADGHTMVTSAPAGSHTLQATRGSTIPSNRLEVCVAAQLHECPSHRGQQIVGSDRGDSIRGTPGPDDIAARRGPDTVHARGGETDSIDCGGGADKAVVDVHDVVDPNCEAVVTG
jgi:hypothetical protein